MSTSPINNLPNNYLQTLLSNGLQDPTATSNVSSNSSALTAASPLSQLPDNGEISPFAQLLSTLQQLQQTDPAKYQQVTQQIATNLDSAAQTAQADGNTAAANQLSALATDFTNASQSGQLPSIQDLAQATGGHHHHHHAHAASSDSDSASSTSSSTTLSQYLSTLQSSGTQNDALNPTSIILNTLKSAGLTG